MNLLRDPEILIQCVCIDIRIIQNTLMRNGTVLHRPHLDLFF